MRRDAWTEDLDTETIASVGERTISRAPPTAFGKIRSRRQPPATWGV
jgi:hypothetical protein